MKLTLDEYVLLVLETQADRDRQVEIQASLQAHMKNTGKITPGAKSAQMLEKNNTLRHLYLKSILGQEEKGVGPF